MGAGEASEEAVVELWEKKRRSSSSCCCWEVRALGGAAWDMLGELPLFAQCQPPVSTPMGCANGNRALIHRSNTRRFARSSTSQRQRLWAG